MVSYMVTCSGNMSPSLISVESGPVPDGWIPGESRQICRWLDLGTYPLNICALHALGARDSIL